MSKPKLHRNHLRHGAGYTHAGRAKLCAEYGVPNTGRQYRNLRKGLQRAVRQAERDREAEYAKRPRRKNAKHIS